MKKKTKNKTTQHKAFRNKPRSIPRGIDSTGIAQSRDTIIHGRFIQQQQEARMLRVGLEASDAPLMVNTEPSYVGLGASPLATVDESPEPKLGFWHKVLDFMGWGD